MTTIKSATTDGAISGVNPTYATARSTASGSNTAGADALLGQNKVTVPSTIYTCGRLFLEFDTSAIPAGATVTAVTLYLKVSVDSSTTNFVPTVRQTAWTSPIGAGDRDASYDACLAGADIANFGSTGTGTWSAGTWKSVALPTGTVVKGGTTQLTMISDRDAAGTAPAGAEYVNFYMADSAGNEPYLDITYTVGHQPFRALIGVGW